MGRLTRASNWSSKMIQYTSPSCDVVPEIRFEIWNRWRVATRIILSLSARVLCTRYNIRTYNENNVTRTRDKRCRRHNSNSLRRGRAEWNLLKPDSREQKYNYYNFLYRESYARGYAGRAERRCTIPVFFSRLIMFSCVTVLCTRVNVIIHTGPTVRILRWK